MKKKKYIIYARSAARPQRGEYSNNKIQIKQLKEFAKQFDFEIVDVISEYGSGMDRSKRRCMNLFRRLKKHEIQGILCTKWDRLTRDFGLFLQLKEMFERNDIEIITLDEDEVDQNTFMYVLYMRKSTEECY